MNMQCKPPEDIQPGWLDLRELAGALHPIRWTMVELVDNGVESPGKTGG